MTDQAPTLREYLDERHRALMLASDERHAALMRSLEEIKEYQREQNGRVDKAEHDIIRLQERTTPAQASGVVGVLLTVLYAVAEYLRK